MTNPLELLKTNAISAVNLLAVLDASATDAERIEAVYAFIGVTAELAGHLDTRDGDDDVDVDALQEALDEARRAVIDRETELEAANRKITQLTDKLAEFEKQLENMNTHSDILTDVAVAHKRIAESMRKNENGDYEGAAKKLMTAEKILQKITGKEYHYD